MSSRMDSQSKFTFQTLIKLVDDATEESLFIAVDRIVEIRGIDPGSTRIRTIDGDVFDLPDVRPNEFHDHLRWEAESEVRDMSIRHRPRR